MQNHKTAVFLGTSPAAMGLRKKVEGVAAMNLPVLLAGEKGSAPEEVAREIHNLSQKVRGPFLRFDCSAIPKGQWDVELFSKLGSAKGGTLFLDRVELMPVHEQEKLAEIFSKSDSKKPDIRLIAFIELETNDSPVPPLEKELNQLLAHFSVLIPALRERKEDIQVLMLHYLRNADQVGGVAQKNLQKDVLQLLLRYHWPGNIFELKTTMEMMAFNAFGKTLNFDDVPFEILVNEIHSGGSKREERLNYKKVREHLEIKIIRKVLANFRGNQTKAAETLGIHRNTLIWKMKELNLVDDYKKMVKKRRERKIGFKGL